MSIQSEYEKALEGNTDLNKKFVKLGELNKLAYKNLILSINISSAVEKVVFGLVMSAKSLDNHNGDCKIAWDRLVNKYAPHIASYL